MCIKLFDQIHRGVYFIRIIGSTAQQDNVRVFNLILKEFAEIVEIRFAAFCIHHCYL